MQKTKSWDNSFRFFIVVISSVIYSIGLMWFLEPANLYAGGLSGVAQLINRIGLIFKVNINIGLSILILNIPILVVGYKYVSFKFALFSFVSIIAQSLCTSGIIPVPKFEGLDTITLSIVGGIVTGLGGGLALRYGTSTGGVDVVAQVLALHKGIGIGIFTLGFNFGLAIIGGGIVQGDWNITLYTFVRIIIGSLVTDKIHTAYNFLSVHIITNETNANALSDALLNELGRGVTLYPAVGAYTKVEKRELFMVLSAYEYMRARNIVLRIDPSAFIVASPVKRLVGNFKRKSIV